MTREVEMAEARQACEKVLSKVREIQAKLKNTQNWGIFDLVAGGFWTSMIKRQKMGDINGALESLRYLVTQAQKELSDVDMTFVSNLSDTGLDFTFDVFFDNIFTDWMVQDDLRKLSGQLELLETKIQHALDTLQ